LDYRWNNVKIGNRNQNCQAQIQEKQNHEKITFPSRKSISKIPLSISDRHFQIRAFVLVLINGGMRYKVSGMRYNKLKSHSTHYLKNLFDEAARSIGDRFQLVHAALLNL
jgi:hypothetical protein